MIEVAAVAVGGAVGALARYGTTLLLVRWFGAGFPWGTLAVNGLGSFVLGVLVGLGAAGPLRPGVTAPGPTVRALVGTGFCGAYTTFSTFSVETLRMPPALAALNVAANLAVSFGAAAAGFAVAGALRAQAPAS